MAQKTFNLPTKIGNDTNFSKALSDLNDRINLLKKEVSYFDLYNISETVTDEKTFSEQLNNLPLNQSIVINTAPFYQNGTMYSTGDILIKSSQGKVFHIPAQTSGVFYPESIREVTPGSDGSYVITFAYSGQAPTQTEPVTVDIGNEASLATKINFQGLKGIQPATIYGIWLAATIDNTKNIYTFNVAKNDSKIVKPVIQFYFCKQTEEDDTEVIPVEQVYVDYVLELITEEDEDGQLTEKWKVTTDQISDLFMKVK